MPFQSKKIMLAFFAVKEPKDSGAYMELLDRLEETLSPSQLKLFNRFYLAYGEAMLVRTEYYFAAGWKAGRRSRKMCYRQNKE